MTGVGKVTIESEGERNTVLRTLTEAQATTEVVVVKAATETATNEIVPQRVVWILTEEPNWLIRAV